MVSAPLGENVRTNRVYKDCPIVVCDKTMCVDLVELPTNDFDVILVIELLHRFYACMDCHSRAMIFFSLMK